MAAPDRWYQHVPPVTALIPCQGAEHRITWRWGKLKLEDHDLGSERAMLVLGGQPCACLRALDLWGSQFGMPPEHFAQMERWLGAEAALAPKELALPREVGVALSWERSWRRTVWRDKHGKLLERQVKDKAVPFIRAHLTAEKQRFGSRVVRGVELRHVAAGQAPATINGRMDSISVSASVTLSSDWIVHVWARGLAVVDGAFILEVLGPGSRTGTTRVRAVRWREQKPGVAEPEAVATDVERVDGGWRFVDLQPQ
jgi:hypothetical protein